MMYIHSFSHLFIHSTVTQKIFIKCLLYLVTVLDTGIQHVISLLGLP